MTTALVRPAVQTSASTQGGRPARGPGGLRSLFRAGLAWPVSALLLGYPIWWALGIADFMWVILAVPMIARMIAWQTRRGRRIKLPPGFGLWLLFLLIVVAGIATITLTAPGTVPEPRRHVAFSRTGTGRSATWATPSCCSTQAT